MASCVLALCIPTATALAKSEPKAYPENGKVIGIGTSESIRATYEVETESEVYKLECEKVPRPGLKSYTPRECGGSRKIQIGDVIHLRKDKSWVYIKIDENGRDTEQKLRILSEELRPGVRPADKAAATPLEKGTKQTDDKQ
jgi:hypothetical protein